MNTAWQECERPLRRLGLFLSLFVFACEHVQAEGSENASPPIQRHIQYSYTLQNTRGKVIDVAEFWVYAPLEKTSHQVCRNVKSSHPYQVIEDNLGNQVLHFTFSQFPPYATKIVTIEADLELRDDPLPVSLDGRDYLRAEPLIEIDDPAFDRLAPRFETGTASQNVDRIFRWTSRNVADSGYRSRSQGALHALEHKEGDCTEFTYVFVALCRSHGIPARALGGYVCAKNTILSPMDYHNWAEFYEDGRWFPADAQRRVLRTTASQFVAINLLGESNSPMGHYPRFRFTGEGLKVKMN